MKLILPFPPSVNTYWRHPNKGAFAGKSLISAAGRKFQSAACAAIVEQLRRLPKPTSAPASVEIVLFPPDNSSVDWQPIAAGFKGLLPHGRKSRIQCDDDEGIIIDGCVARLRKYKPEEYELIIAHFVIGISLRTIAKKRRCSDGTIRKELQTAIGFVEGITSVMACK